jgi:hypothetical protein
LYRKLNDSLAKQLREQEIANERLTVTRTLQEQFPHHAIGGESKGPSVRRWNGDDAGSSLKLVSAEPETETSKARQDSTNEQGEDDPAELLFGRSDHSIKSTTNSVYPKLYKDKPAERVLPCYSWAQHRKCPTGSACVWSHDDKICREYAEKQVAMFAESPYLNSKVKDAIVAAYPSAVSSNVKGNHSSVAFRSPISQSVNGKMLLLESDDMMSANDRSEQKLSDAKIIGDY